MDRRTSGRAPNPASGANQVWAYDFVFDACANGQKLKCLTVIDEYTREALAIEVAGSIRSRHVIEVLSRLVSVRGAPRYLRSDNGPEFVSAAILRWVGEAGITGDDAVKIARTFAAHGCDLIDVSAGLSLVSSGLWGTEVDSSLSRALRQGDLQ